MDQYILTEKEDYALHNIVQFRKGRTLCEYMVEMPLKDLQAYPERGWRWWMGRSARTGDALKMRDYVLHWRLFALEFSRKYSKDHLEKLSTEALSDFVRRYTQVVPQWAYEKPVRDALRILFDQDKLI